MIPACEDYFSHSQSYFFLASSNETSKKELHALRETVLEKNDISTLEVAKRLAKIPVSFEPGTDYQYGLSADIMGAVIEVASGMKYSEFLKKEIFEPLGMNDTTFKNCHGIDEDGHVTSAYDISLMSKELLNNHPSITIAEDVKLGFLCGLFILILII